MVVYKKVFGLVFFLLAGLAVSASAVNISGNINGVLTADYNPYNVVGNLRIPPFDTLIIEPGCYFNFTGHYKFNIDSMAVLLAIGTEEDSIVFTASNTIAGWFGLRFNYADSGSRLSYCSIRYGRAADHFQDPDNKGGGVYCANTRLTIDHCNLSNNWAWEGWGGAIYGTSSEMIISNNNISYNHSGKGGSGIFLDYSTAFIDSNIIEHDSTYYPLGGEWGGGVNLSSSDAIISNNMIRYNFCGFVGGGAVISGSNVTMNNNIIAHNRSWESGTGLYILNSSVYLNNCIMYSNLMDEGPRTGKVNISSLRSHLVISNCLSYDGHISISSGISDTIINSILMDNNGTPVYCLNETLTVRYSNIQGGWPGEGNIDADPLFADTANGDFRLTWVGFPLDDSGKSPCIDSGDPSSPLDPDSTRADMGAYYFNQHTQDITDQPILPHNFLLLDNYPNPFNAQTVLRYTTPTQSPVTIAIYDILGRKVQTLVDCTQPAGEHQVTWNANDIPSGVYFYRLTTGGQTQTKKMVMIR